MNVLTREEAIKRIKDIRAYIGVDHLIFHTQFAMYKAQQDMAANIGAQRELMAIFDIKESDL